MAQWLAVAARGDSFGCVNLMTRSHANEKRAGSSSDATTQLRPAIGCRRSLRRRGERGEREAERARSREVGKVVVHRDGGGSAGRCKVGPL